MKPSIQIKGHKHILYRGRSFSEEEMFVRSENYYLQMNSRRSVREFSNRPVPKVVIENIIKTASTAPSGAHKQPWTFCAIANRQTKLQIKEAAEAEERQSYKYRMSERWKEDLIPMATDAHKLFLEIAPWLIVVFKKVYEYDQNKSKHNNYYVNESIGIACGILISVIHHVGLVTLTHTPSPMKFLEAILNRPANERAFLLLPVGYPKEPTYVPELQRKTLGEMSVFYD